MFELKGPPRTVIAFKTESNHVELMRFADQSWAIRCNGKVLGAWEAIDEDDCFRTFIRMVEQSKRQSESIVVMRRSDWDRFDTHAN